MVLWDLILPFFCLMMLAKSMTSLGFLHSSRMSNYRMYWQHTSQEAMETLPLHPMSHPDLKLDHFFIKLTFAGACGESSGVATFSLSLSILSPSWFEATDVPSETTESCRMGDWAAIAKLTTLVGAREVSGAGASLITAGGIWIEFGSLVINLTWFPGKNPCFSSKKIPSYQSSLCNSTILIMSPAEKEISVSYNPIWFWLIFYSYSFTSLAV